jgi:threonine synthase
MLIGPYLLVEMVFNAYKVSENKFTTPHTANLVALERNQHILELFNGPTGSFKDFALQLFPQFFDYYANIERDQSLLAAQPNPSKYCILVSTSGDTGSATADGFCTQTDIPVIILYPADGVSPVQKAQMVPSAAMSKLSVLPVADADFDFCQSSLKTIFNDNEFIARVQQRYNYKFSGMCSLRWICILQVC